MRAHPLALHILPAITHLPVLYSIFQIRVLQTQESKRSSIIKLLDLHMHSLPTLVRLQTSQFLISKMIISSLKRLKVMQEAVTVDL